VQDRLRYPAERIEEIRRLAIKHTDVEIAEWFSRRGQRRSRGKRFTGKMIGWIRYKHRIPDWFGLLRLFIGRLRAFFLERLHRRGGF